MADWADLHRGTSLGHTCAYCKRPLERPERAAVGQTTGLLYCPDSDIAACNTAFGKRVGHLDVRDWKATVVQGV